MSRSFYIYETQFKGVEDMEKIKLTVEQGKAIESLLVVMSADGILNEFARGVSSSCGSCWQYLNELPMSELARALLVGYEVEETFKVGDWVSLIGSPLTTFKIYAVRNSHAVPDWLKGIYDCGDTDVRDWMQFNTIRHATPEEIKAEQERRVWKSIGRRYQEIKVGDISIFKDNTFGRIVNVELAIRDFECGHIVKLYPIETAIDLRVESDD